MNLEKENNVIAKKTVTFDMDLEKELNAIAEEIVTFGMDTEAELTVTIYPKNGHTSVKAMRDCMGKLMVDFGNQNLVLKGPREMMYVNTPVVPVQKNLLSEETMIDAGHEVVFRKSGSYIRNEKTGRWHSLRRVRNTYEVDFKLEPYSSAVPPPPPPHFAARLARH